MNPTLLMNFLSPVVQSNSSSFPVRRVSSVIVSSVLSWNSRENVTAVQLIGNAEGLEHFALDAVEEGVLIEFPSISFLLRLRHSKEPHLRTKYTTSQIRRVLFRA